MVILSFSMVLSQVSGHRYYEGEEERECIIDVASAISRVSPGGIARYTLHIRPIGGFHDRVTLGVSGIPENSIGIFDPISGIPYFSSKLIVITTASTPTGAYNLTIVGTSDDEAIAATEVALIIVAGGTTTTTVHSTTWTGSGTKNATKSLLLSISTDKPGYNANETVTISGFVKDASMNSVSGANVSIQVVDPKGNSVRMALARSSISGYFHDNFTLRSDAMVGTYTVYATASAEGYEDGQAHTTFTVGASPVASIKIVNVYTTDPENNTQTSFSPGESFIVWIVVENTGADLSGAIVWVEVDDPRGVPIQVSYQVGDLKKGQTLTAGFSVSLPASGPSGAYRVSGFVSDKMISAGGKFLATQQIILAVE